jgi:hypothetical protein
MVYPATLSERLKYVLWRVLTPIHPHIRDIIPTKIVERLYSKYRPNGRQHYLLGHLAQQETIESLVAFLVERGFGNHFVALRDEGEVVGLRHVPNFKYQYHIRIFEDGEVRGHYEYTTECHPFRHDRGEGFEDRTEEFLELLGDKIVPVDKD